MFSEAIQAGESLPRCPFFVTERLAWCIAGVQVRLCLNAFAPASLARYQFGPPTQERRRPSADQRFSTCFIPFSSMTRLSSRQLFESISGQSPGPGTHGRMFQQTGPCRKELALVVGKAPGRVACAHVRSWEAEGSSCTATRKELPQAADSVRSLRGWRFQLVSSPFRSCGVLWGLIFQVTARLRTRKAHYAMRALRRPQRLCAGRGRERDASGKLPRNNGARWLDPSGRKHGVDGS